MRVRSGGKAQHGEPVGCWREDVVSFMWWRASGDKEYFIKVEPDTGFFGDGEMAVVNGIECSSEDA